MLQISDVEVNIKIIHVSFLQFFVFHAETAPAELLGYGILERLAKLFQNINI